MSGSQGILGGGKSSKGGKGIPGGGGNSGGGGSHNEFRKNFALIEKGMSKKEVIDLLGAPDDVKTRYFDIIFTSGNERWVYVVWENRQRVYYKVDFLNGKVSGKYSF